MTWHAKALTTSYLLGARASGAAPAGDESERGFPFSTTSWYFLDAVDVMPRRRRRAWWSRSADSITDGTASTLNGDDRWPDVLARRLHAAFGDRVSGGQRPASAATRWWARRVTRPRASRSPAARRRGSGWSAMCWRCPASAAVIVLEGINDLGTSGQRHAGGGRVRRDAAEIAARLRARIPGVRVIGATLTPALGSSNPAPGRPRRTAKRQATQHLHPRPRRVRCGAGFRRATLDPATGSMRAEFVPESTPGGAGDQAAPNRAGYAAMAQASIWGW